MEDSKPASAKGDVLLTGTDHVQHVSVHRANEEIARDPHVAKGLELLGETPPNNNEEQPGDPIVKELDEEARDDGIGPRGRWSTDLCDCVQIIGCTPLCGMTVCCGIIVLAQLMTRLGLDWCGVPNPAKAAATFSVVILVYFSFWASYLMVFGIIFFPCMVFYLLAILTRTRYELRRYFQIPADYCTSCNGALEDCLCTTFCQCCSLIQMERHTHDETRYPYEFSEPTGLPPEAPPLYEDAVVMDRI